MDCIWENLKNVGPPFFKFTPYVSNTRARQLENHSQLLFGHDFAKERLFSGLPI